jgi:hypothetical protein
MIPVLQTSFSSYALYIKKKEKEKKERRQVEVDKSQNIKEFRDVI